MKSGISLTASMRNNLLSLQGTNKLMDLTQERLSTGKKVNSAIDNPSSFYTAQSLENRAKDLDALLDSMGQAISTVKAATTGIETGVSFLEQATAVANQAVETAVPPKSYFEDKVGANGAVVTTAQEFSDAIAAGKETICVYGNIDLEKITSTITLSDNQKLVGVNYFGNFDKGFSSVSCYSVKNIAMITTSNNNEIADLNINYETSGGRNVLSLYGTDNKISNLEISFNRTGTGLSTIAVVQLKGEGATLSTSNISIFTKGGKTSGLSCFKNTQLTVSGEFNYVSEDSSSGLCVMTASAQGGAKINILDNAKISANKIDHLFKLNSSTSGVANTLSISKGCDISVGDKAYDLTKDSLYDTNREYVIDEYDIYGIMKGVPTQKWYVIKSIKNEAPQVSFYQYQSIIDQYNNVISDSTYKGVNLLKGHSLNVNFNEKGTSSINIIGEDINFESSNEEGIAWQNQGDIQKSLADIANMVSKIHNLNRKLRDNYSTISNRFDFTNSMINILTEGADKLTLADMSEESANMLSLQTRQQLAVNALSLSSQASQSILKLF